MRPDFLAGAIDLHIHSAPDIMERVGSSIDIARDAARAGMRAIVLKDHVFPSFIKAELTRQVVPEIRVFGGIALNNSVGGLSAYSVKAALAGGARVVMFPTLDAVWNLSRPHMPLPQAQQALGEARTPVPVVGEDGRLLAAAEAILRIVAGRPEVILSSGHLGPEEVLPLFERARALGIARMVVEHPNTGDHFSEGDLLRLTELGAVIALGFNAYHPAIHRRDPREAVNMIRLVGAHRCVLITDSGQAYSARPPEAMRIFCEILYQLGLTLEEIFTMVRVNPAWLLSLDEAVAGSPVA